MVACEQASFMVFSFVWSFFPSVFHAQISRHFCPLKLAMLIVKLNRQQCFLVCALLDHRNVQNFVVKPLTCGSYFIFNFEHFYAISMVSKSIRTCRIVAQLLNSSKEPWMAFIRACLPRGGGPQVQVR